MADVTKRMLDLLAVLQTGRRFSGAELARSLETSPRTLRRDVERLREYGYPVTTRPGPSGFYQLGPGTRLPPLIFEDDEAVAVLIGLAMAASAARAPESPQDGGHRESPAGIGASADRAYGKVDQLLPARLRSRVRLVRASMEVSPTSSPVVDTAVFTAIGEACTRRERIRFGYRGPDGTLTSRKAEPFRQILARQRWYLLAWDLDRDDWRTFRIDRIHDLIPTGEHFAPRPIPADDGRAYLRDALTRARYRAVVTVDAPAETVADKVKFADCSIEPLDGGRCRVTASVDSFHWLIINIGLIGAEFRIHSPAEFADLSRELAGRLMRAGRHQGP
ncbi:helix-turn-helix transcriptional regulator [Actinocorallia populi]|uniref:helix-turn-helix transcriptional regulator n=1 Tax=Actinocorallia populi TaxID=2079200 RepID=UPI0018E530FD|nr:YafY family protein [Actinocorallia populi]